MNKIAFVGMLAFAAVGCGGGGEKGADEPVQSGGDEGDVDQSGGTDGAMIPAEKFDEIKRTFERKQTMISRCFVAGVDAGEVNKTDKGRVTVSAVITPAGKATNVRVVESDFKSPALEACIKDYVSRWLFTTLPRELEYSYQYRLERF